LDEKSVTYFLNGPSHVQHSLNSQARHLSQFCHSKVADNGSKVYLAQDIGLAAHES